LSPLDLVKELKATFGTITHHEISATETAIAAPLAQFTQFRDFCSNATRNYEFLQTAGHNVPELTRIDVFVSSLSTWPQFEPHISFWKTTTAFDQRTLQSLIARLLSQYGEMPPESQPFFSLTLIAHLLSEFTSTVRVRESRYVIKVMSLKRKGENIPKARENQGCTGPFNWAIIKLI
jgi:hypothetical protein